MTSAEMSPAEESAPPPVATHEGLRYQAEVDGLRAIAVVPVVLFHAGFAGFSAGYLGVDVFFVISGYLITTLVLRDIAGGRFSILGFYERRARRILPALFFVSLCAVPLALLLMFPWQVADFGRSLTATMGFYANQYFLSTLDYFREGSDHAPFLHMWSLAVEEQYYLLVPPALWLAWRLGARRRALLLMALGASLLSLVGAALIVTRWQQTAFYIFPTRAFELGIGSLLALLLLDRPRPSGRANGPLALAGLAMVVAPMLALPSWAVLPSWPTLVPCIGTALVIAYATPGTLVHRLLASPVFVAVGLISFSLYLWHQPLFAFARVSEARPSPALMAGLALLATALAALTWRWVERPTRRAPAPRGQVLAVAAIGLFGFAAIGQLLAFGAGWLRSPDPVEAQLEVSPIERGAYVASRYNALPRDFSQAAPGQKKLLIIGDSHSQDFYNMVRETGAFYGWAVATRYIPNRCQTYFGTEDVSSLISAAEVHHCAVTRDPGPVPAQADVIVLVASWKDWAARRIGDTIAGLAARPDQTVIVIGNKGFGDLFLRGYEDESRAALAAVTMAPPPEIVATNADLRAATPAGVGFVDMEAVLCPGGVCHPFTPKGELLSHDGDHLTETGAMVFGARLFQQPALSGFLTHPEGRDPRESLMGLHFSTPTGIKP